MVAGHSAAGFTPPHNLLAGLFRGLGRVRGGCQRSRHCIGVLFDDGQQHPGGAFWPAPLLLPLADSSDWKCEFGSEFILAQTELLPDLAHVDVRPCVMRCSPT
jgi:hypothetical protein